jgi:glycosyltransferase involved in cell wall biosynthesis
MVDLSIVIISYNTRDLLDACLKSLQKAQQPVGGIEIIVVDNGSSDRTWDVLEGIERPCLRLHRCQTPKGRAEMLNRALGWASGEFVVCHEVGDVSAPERLEKQVAVLRRRKEAALAISAVDWVDEEGQILWRFECPNQHRLIVNRLRRQEGQWIQGAMMLRRQVLEAVGGVRPALSLAADYDLWLRMANSGRLAGIPDTLYTITFSPEKTMIARQAEFDDYTMLARQLADEREEHGCELTDAESASAAIAARYARMNPLTRRSLQATSLLGWADRLIDWGGPAQDQAWRLWWHALAVWPFSGELWRFAKQHDTNKPLNHDDTSL